MKNDDYIRAGVELAPDIGWVGDDGSIFFHGVPEKVINPNNCPQWFKDTLAAQLRNQAQADPHIVFKISVVDSSSYVEMLIYNPNGDEEASPLRHTANETDEAMAFLKVIVGSEILNLELNE